MLGGNFMLKKKLCILVTAATLLGCMAFPVAADSFTYGLEGKYIDVSIMSVRLAGHSYCDSGTLAVAHICLVHKNGKCEGKDLKKYGGGHIYTNWTYKSDVKTKKGHGYFY